MLSRLIDTLTPRRMVLATAGLFLLSGVLMLAPAFAQDREGEEVVSVAEGDPAPAAAQGFSDAELEELVGPVALYPDDLLAIVLPASTYPVQLVQAQRFLEQRQEDPALQPDEDWDDAVVALLNYPEVLALLNEDLDWTWRLGEAVLNQQEQVFDAIGRFRQQAYAAGNLKSDDRQQVVVEEGVIEIEPADPEVIYVPYYEPARVVVYQPYPVYHYYSYPRPVYYYPYPVGYSFSYGFFWGVSTAFVLGWDSGHVHVHHYYYPSHPYYRHHYHDRYYLRHYSRPRPEHYHDSPVVHNRYYQGDRWQPRHGAGGRPAYREREQHQLGSTTGYSARGGQRYRPQAIDRQVAAARQPLARPAGGTTPARVKDSRAAAVQDRDRDGHRAVSDRAGRSNYSPGNWQRPVKQYTASQRQPIAAGTTGNRDARQRVLENARPAVVPGRSQSRPSTQRREIAPGTRETRPVAAAREPERQRATRQQTAYPSRDRSSAVPEHRPVQVRDAGRERSAAQARQPRVEPAPARAERRSEQPPAPRKESRATAPRSESRERPRGDRRGDSRERRK